MVVTLNAAHQAILEKRGIEGESLDRFGVISDKGDWIKIPYIQAGKTVNWKSRTIAGEKQFRQEKGAVKCFWNVDCIVDPALADKPLIICEGEFDAMIALQCGYPRVVSVPDGAPATEIGAKDSQKYTYLENVQGLDDVKEIILATDTDGPGLNLMNDLALRLRRPRCKYLRYPKGCKDLNEVFLKYGKKGVDATFAKAEWFQIKLSTMGGLPPLPEKRVYSIGMLDLYKHYNIRKGDFCAVTGIPGHGKTSFLNEIACRMTMNHNWHITFASFEQNPQSDHRRNLRSFYNSKLVKNQTAQEIAEADAWIEKHFSFIVPDDDDEVTVDWVLECCAGAVIRHNTDMIIIDPWNEMDHNPDGISLTQYTGQAIKTFKRFARKYNIALIVAAHPSKPMKEPGGKIRIPTLYDISDSAHWYNKSDVGIIVHKYEDHTVIRIAKTKFHTEIGMPGDVLCTFNIETQTYSPFTKDAA